MQLCSCANEYYDHRHLHVWPGLEIIQTNLSWDSPYCFFNETKPPYNVRWTRINNLFFILKLTEIINFVIKNIFYKHRNVFSGSQVLNLTFNRVMEISCALVDMEVEQNRNDNKINTILINI